MPAAEGKMGKAANGFARNLFNAAEIGRRRKAGEPAPEPLARPANIAEIGARTVFEWTDLDFDKRN